MNLKQDKLSENHTQKHYNQTSKNKDKENILKTDRENNILYIREWLFELSQISHQKSWKKDDSGIFLKCWRENSQLRFL